MASTDLAAFDLVASWPVERVAVGAIDRSGDIHLSGDRGTFRIASVSKVMTAWATLIAVEDGSVSLDDPVGDAGCTLRHLLAHTGGYGFDTREAIVSPGKKRIYSNTGYDMIGAHVAERVEMDFDEYLAEAVFAPLGMDGADLLGSPAKDVHCTIDDLAAFVDELRTPQLIAPATALEATTNQFGDVEGVVPGLGKFSPCNWGLGPEIRGHKWPHWTGSRNSSSTFGHFGGSGTFMWVDPVAHVAAFSLANREFDEWAMECWPTFSDAILAELGRN